MTGRRGLTLVIVLCAVGAAVVLIAVGRTWTVEVTARPAPLPELRTARSGGELRPWLPALAWAALAGAGALIATRGTARRVVAGLLVLAGAGIIAGAGAEAVTGPRAGWPALAAAGGLAVAAAGAAAVARSRDWPAMGARYERGGGGARRRAGPRDADRPEVLWEALDRGEDPTLPGGNREASR